MRRRLGTTDRRIIALAVPALGALIVEPLYNLTDSGIVGHLGKVPLGGLAIATAALNVVGWIAAFLEMATVSVVSFRRAGGEIGGAGAAVGAAYGLSLVVGVITAGLIELLAPVLVAVLGGGGHPGVTHDAVEYLRIAAVGMPALFAALAGNGHLTGLADTRRPLAVAVASNVLNVIAEIALVYGAHLGLAGSAWGTVGAQVVSAVLFVTFSGRAPIRPRRPRPVDVTELLRDALPLTVRTAALGSALLATTAIAARLGTTVLGGHQIAIQIWGMLSLTLDALAVPAQVFVSEALGRSEWTAARDIGRRTLRMGVLAGTLLGALTAALAGIVPSVFSPNPSVDHQATLALLVCGLQQPLAAGAFVLDGLVLGASEYGAMRRSMLLALVAFAPLAGLTLAVPSIGILGIWFSMLCWLIARCVLLGRRWRAISTAFS